MPKKTYSDGSDATYKEEQKTVKSRLQGLVLQTQDVQTAHRMERASKLENQWTAKSLFQSTINFKAWRKKYSKAGQIVLHKPIPYRGTSSILFTATVTGVTQYPDKHRVLLMFSGLKFAKEPFKGCIDIEYKGHTYYVEQPSLNRTSIRVRCSCKDFYFCFSLWDYLQRAIVGPKPKAYKRKTPPPSQGGRAYVNPGHIPGLCKHVFWILQYLKSRGYVKA